MLITIKQHSGLRNTSLQVYILTPIKAWSPSTSIAGRMPLYQRVHRTKASEREGERERTKASNRLKNIVNYLIVMVILDSNHVKLNFK